MKKSANVGAVPPPTPREHPQQPPFAPRATRSRVTLKLTCRTRCGEEGEAALLSAIRINAKGREVVYLAKGDSVKLGCPYELEPQDHGPNGLDIEWTRLNSDPTGLDNVLASVGDCCSSLLQRVNFALPDPSQYDASISLQNVQVSDSATYECKVKKTNVATRKVTVTVLERPSAPHCSIAGNKAVSHEVTLSCSSGAGTPPLMYRWAKIADQPVENGNWLSPTTVKGPRPGDLVIPELSQAHVGVYQCSVANKVGSAECILELSLSEDSIPVGITWAAVLGSLLFLLLLLCLVVGLIYCRRRRRHKEEASQIRVDAAPPRTRGRSKSGSLRSVLSYLPHNISFTSRQKYDAPKDQEGIEIIPSGQDADPGSVMDPGSRGNKIHKNDPPPAEVITKASAHCKPILPSYAQSKSRAVVTSYQLPISSKPGRSGSSELSQDATQVQPRHPGGYGGVPVMVSSRSREGLVV
ncbi:hypothetical protein JRQ81_009447 [Phrynocephalus forsythii]|uniref:Ig-like domain-containing protein n=1 Tax=Phrynocephalus forsythii TaxID=171643 RepID=A0A9Q1ASJ3_9SAUR|nr:hypothetical protein JRQ81_009447 [Phrynocephalus forsythii]